MTASLLPQPPTSAAGSPSVSVPPLPATRLDWVDVCRGVAVLLVVVHHVSGATLSDVAQGGTLYYAGLTLNRMTQAVVPTFLLLSALVFARSSPAGLSWRRYLNSRARQLLWPYVLWTALFLGFRGVTGQGPEAGAWLSTFFSSGLLRGNGYFHLYYLFLALQAVVLLPLLRQLNRVPLRFGWVVVATAALQLGVYALNLHFWHRNDVGSLLLWYLPAVLLGTALGAWPGRFERLWATHRRTLTVACLLALAVYLPLGFAAVRGTLTSTLPYSAANWVYTALAALVLSGLSLQLSRLERAKRLGGWLSVGGGPNLGTLLAGRISVGFRTLGRLSLQIYLLHPVILWALDRLTFPAAALPQLLTGVLYTLLAAGLPLALALALQGRAASVWLFGR